jgi:prevent-host-death family protein
MAVKMSKESPISSRKRAPSSQPWQLQTAEAQFSEVFRRARERAPEVVTRQDKEAVVIVAIEEFERLTHRAAQSKSFAKFFADSPLADLASILSENPIVAAPWICERLPNRYERHLGTHPPRASSFLPGGSALEGKSASEAARSQTAIALAPGSGCPSTRSPR